MIGIIEILDVYSCRSEDRFDNISIGQCIGYDKKLYLFIPMADIDKDREGYMDFEGLVLDIVLQITNDQDYLNYLCHNDRFLEDFMRN